LAPRSVLRESQADGDKYEYCNPEHLRSFDHPFSGIVAMRTSGAQLVEAARQDLSAARNRKMQFLFPSPSIT